jgi:hypothetical protein
MVPLSEMGRDQPDFLCFRRINRFASLSTRGGTTLAAECLRREELYRRSECGSGDRMLTMRLRPLGCISVEIQLIVTIAQYSA